MPEINDNARRWLVEVATDVLDHGTSGTFTIAPEVTRRSAENYTDAERFNAELRRLFRRIPLLLAASCEIQGRGDFRTYQIAGVPVLLTRDADGQARALVNICTHRGAPVAHGAGHCSRFTCSYHGWTFGLDGRLAAVSSAADFGAVDRGTYGLRQLPVLEKGGMIWAILDPESTLDIDAFLGMFGEALSAFDLTGWMLVSEKTLTGANWKLAFDAHMEFYHLPVLHKNTFGPQTSPRALYYFEGPHQRLIRPVRYEKNGMPARADLFQWAEHPQDTWPIESMMMGEWILFPNVSFNSFYDGGRGVLVSRIYPGETVGESITVQSYYMAGQPSDAERAEAQKTADFLEGVVAGEDLVNSRNQQRALDSGLLREVSYGCNERGIVHFHEWVDRILAASDAELNTLFRDGRATA